jgi:transposase
MMQSWLDRHVESLNASPVGISHAAAVVAAAQILGTSTDKIILALEEDMQRRFRQAEDIVAMFLGQRRIHSEQRQSEIVNNLRGGQYR